MDNNLIKTGDIIEPLIPTTLCEICYESRELQNLQCKHSFCILCLKLYLKDKVLDGNVLIIKCPKTDCRCRIRQGIIRDLLDDEWFEKYLLMHEKNTKERIINFRRCPQKNCQGFDEFKGDNKLVCGYCKIEFCFLCSKNWNEVQCRNTLRFNGKEFSKWVKDKKIILCKKCRLPVKRIRSCDMTKGIRYDFRFCWLCEQSMSYLEENNYLYSEEYNDEYNDEWFIILVLLFLPLSFLLLIFIIAVIYVINYSTYGVKNRPFLGSSISKEFLLVVSFILSPVLMILSLAVIPVLALVLGPYLFHVMIMVHAPYT